MFFQLDIVIPSLLMGTQTSPCTLHHGHQHLLFPPRQQRNFNSCFPNTLQLYRSRLGVHHVHNLQVRMEEISQAPPRRRMEIYHSFIHGRPRKLLHRSSLSIYRTFLLPSFSIYTNLYQQNILSAQLLNFWSIVCVVIVSFTLLRVRYKWAQIAGILICCGGMGMLLASDHITGSNGGDPPTQVKGDLFGLVGATFYGLSNVFEEWFVSKRPAYEVLGMLGLFGVIINGITASIFDRASFQSATWDGQVGGYIVGYTLALFIFYTLAPLILRMASAAFFDISLLTGNFWGVIIGIKVFGYTIYYLYPIAFVLIICGLVVYFLAGSMLGDSKKPWLGKNQEQGVAGLGTAKLKAIHEARREGLVGSGVVV
jgi:drug/metabolite transporter (DMT)-like permease